MCECEHVSSVHDCMSVQVGVGAWKFLCMMLCVHVYVRVHEM